MASPLAYEPPASFQVQRRAQVSGRASIMPEPRSSFCHASCFRFPSPGHMCSCVRSGSARYPTHAGASTHTLSLCVPAVTARPQSVRTIFLEKTGVRTAAHGADGSFLTVPQHRRSVTYAAVRRDPQPMDTHYQDKSLIM